MHSRSLKIAGVAALTGMMIAVIIVDFDRKPIATPAIATAGPSQRSNTLERELDRCATITMPDSGCEAAWAANRRRFFGQEDEAHGASSDQATVTGGTTTNEQALPEVVTSPAAERTRP